MPPPPRFLASAPRAAVSEFHIRGRPVDAARAAAARGLRSAPRLPSGRAPPPGRPGPGPWPLDAGAAGEDTRWSPGRGAGVPRLAGCGALRARQGGHSDEIPAPGPRHQPASAFLLLSQIETEGGGREWKKKATRKGGRSLRGARADPRRRLCVSWAREGRPRRRETPALRARPGRAPRLYREQGRVRLERNSSQLLRHGGSAPAAPPRALPLGPRPLPHSFLLGRGSGPGGSGLLPGPVC